MKFDNDNNLLVILMTVIILVFASIFGILGMPDDYDVDTVATMPLRGDSRPVETISEDLRSTVLLHIVYPMSYENALVETDAIAEESPKYFDVPLEEGLQDYIFALCEESEIDPAIVIAMIKTESNFDSSAIGDKGNSKGLMQIQQRFHEDRMKRLMCTDLLNPYQNVTVGIDLLSELMDKGKGLEWALMAYNGGAAYANKYAASGTLSKYASKVLTYSENLIIKEYSHD